MSVIPPGDFQVGALADGTPIVAVGANAGHRDVRTATQVKLAHDEFAARVRRQMTPSPPANYPNYPQSGPVRMPRIETARICNGWLVMLEGSMYEASWYAPDTESIGACIAAIQAKWELENG